MNNKLALLSFAKAKEIAEKHAFDDLKEFGAKPTQVALFIRSQQLKNPAPRPFFKAELDAMGLTVKYQGPLQPQYKGMTFLTTQGEPIPMNQMRTIVFVKKGSK